MPARQGQTTPVLCIREFLAANFAWADRLLPPNPDSRAVFSGQYERVAVNHFIFVDEIKFGGNIAPVGELTVDGFVGPGSNVLWIRERVSPIGVVFGEPRQQGTGLQLPQSKQLLAPLKNSRIRVDSCDSFRPVVHR